ncbi:MAG: hypothetical protein WDW38_004053 [Sanguina aurantia]
MASPPVMGAHLMASGIVAPTSTSKGPGMDVAVHEFQYHDQENDVTVVLHATPAAAVNGLTRLITDASVAAIKAKGSFTLVLSGGSLLNQLAQLAVPAQKGNASIAWDKVHIFFADERNVPHDSADSNYKGALASFLGKVPIPAGQVHAILENLPVRNAAVQYEGQLMSLPPSILPVNADGLPVFDCILLGVGPDGHTASLFPNRVELSWTSGSCLCQTPPKPPAERITLSLPVINAGKEVVFVALGESKAEVVQRVLEVQALPGSLPAQLIRPKTGRLKWLLDVQSAQFLDIASWGESKRFPRSIELAIQQQADVKAALLNFARRRPDIIFAISSGDLTALSELKMPRGEGADLERKLKNADRRLKETFLLNKHDDGASHASLQDLLRVVWEWVQTPEPTLNRIAPGERSALPLLTWEAHHPHRSIIASEDGKQCPTGWRKLARCSTAMPVLVGTSRLCFAPPRTLHRWVHLAGLPVLLGVLLRAVTVQSLSPPGGPGSGAQQEAWHTKCGGAADARLPEGNVDPATDSAGPAHALKAGLTGVQERKKVEADIFMQRRHKMRLRNAASSTVLELGDWFCAMCGNVNWRNKKACAKCALPANSLGNTAIVAQDISDLYGAGNRAPERNSTRNTDLDSAFGSLTSPRRPTPTSAATSRSDAQTASEPQRDAGSESKGRSSSSASSSASSGVRDRKGAAEGRAAAAAADDELMSWDKPVIRRQLQLTRVVPAPAAGAGRGPGRAAAAERQQQQRGRTRGQNDEDADEDDDDDGEEAEQDDDDGDGGRDVQRRRGASVGRPAAGRRDEEQDYGAEPARSPRSTRPSSRQPLRDEDAEDGGGGGRERGAGRMERREARMEETALFSRSPSRSGEGRGRGAASVSDAREGEDDEREEQRGSVLREQHSLFYEGGRRADRGVGGDEGEPDSGGSSSRYGGGGRGEGRGMASGRGRGGSARGSAGQYDVEGGGRSGGRERGGFERGRGSGGARDSAYGEGVEVSRGGSGGMERERGGRQDDGDGFEDGEERGYGGRGGGRGRGGGGGGGGGRGGGRGGRRDSY